MSRNYKWGEHEPLVKEIESKIRVIKCQCGEQLDVSNKTWVSEKHSKNLVGCPKCGLIYAPISDYRSGQDRIPVISHRAIGVCGVKV